MNPLEIRERPYYLALELAAERMVLFSVCYGPKTISREKAYSMLAEVASAYMANFINLSASK